MSGSNTIRFTGLASGMDTEALVNAMLMTQKNKIDKQTKTQQKSTWKQEAWKEMNKKLADFQSKYVDKLKTQGFFAQNKVTSSNESAIYVNPNTNMPKGTHEIEINELATSAKKATKKIEGTDVKKTTKLSELGLGDTTISINKDVDGRGIANKDKVQLRADMTLEEVATAIEASDSNLEVNFDESNQRFFITSKITGTKSRIQIEGVDTNGSSALARLGLSGDEADTTKETAGHDAVYYYNGTKLESATNKVNVNGMEITLKAKTTEPVTIQTEKDIDGIVKSLKEFVTAYNELMDDLNTKLTTKTKSTYEPLTDEEKEKMTDKQIEKIENYIKEGLFYRDESLMAVRDTLRDTMGEVVKETTKYSTLYSIGIRTGDWREQGKLHIDEEGEKLLRKALEENPEDVMKIFAGSGDDEEQGIFTRIYKRMYASKDSLSCSLDEVRSFGSFYNDKLLTKEMKSNAEKIEELNKKYNEQETRLYKKFTAMEKTISQLNSQQSYLTSMLAQ